MYFSFCIIGRPIQRSLWSILFDTTVRQQRRIATKIGHYPSAGQNTVRIIHSTDIGNDSLKFVTSWKRFEFWRNAILTLMHFCNRMWYKAVGTCFGIGIEFASTNVAGVEHESVCYRNRRTEGRRSRKSTQKFDAWTITFVWPGSRSRGTCSAFV